MASSAGPPPSEATLMRTAVLLHPSSRNLGSRGLGGSTKRHKLQGLMKQHCRGTQS